MIKMYHKMMRRKGFTLVELVVVVAIVGILAAVLIPTLFGVVTKARVASLNSTAGDIRRQSSLFMVDAEVQGFCMKLSEGYVETFYINVKDGTWECTSAADPSHFNKRDNTPISWGHGGAESRYKAGTDPGTITSGEKFFCMWMADLFPQLDRGSVAITFKGGVCTFVAMSSTSDAKLNTNDVPKPGTDGEAPETFVWNGRTAGVSRSGEIIGTAPVVGTK